MTEPAYAICEQQRGRSVCSLTSVFVICYIIYSVHLKTQHFYLPFFRVKRKVLLDNLIGVILPVDKEYESSVLS